MFQRRHGILLPDDYREFITEIGDGGAGPYYGVKPLANAAKYTDLSTPFPWGSEMSPRSHSDRKLWEILPGVLVVAELGCGGTNVLVVNGCEEGWVWEDLTIEDLPLSPLHQSFSEWYIGWAERCIATIKREPLIDQVRIGMTVDEVRGILGDDIQQWGGFQSPDLPAYYISFTTTNASFSIDWDGRVMKINKWDFI
ncbi:MAG: SMI1/KNR4 family protein [Planctomycetaceae bacterium]|nr:SMI1/KNR4 family protein [Planctomycetaceae bacterium]